MKLTVDLELKIITISEQVPLKEIIDFISSIDGDPNEWKIDVHVPTMPWKSYYYGPWYRTTPWYDTRPYYIPYVTTGSSPTITGSVCIGTNSTNISSVQFDGENVNFT